MTLRVRDLGVEIAGARVVDGVSLDVGAGEIVAITGESGSGKSMTALAVMRLLPEGARATGRIALGGRDLTAASERELCGVRGAAIGMVFQEPMTALDPLLPIGDQVAETVRLHAGASRAEAAARAREALARAEMPPDRFPPSRYPHELSGGQRQRVCIAMATALRPEVLIADEPTTALDVTTQGRILALLRRLVAEDGMALLMITHDLAVVAGMADRIAVMREGRIVEAGPAARVLSEQRHPYTRALIEASAHVPARTRTASGANGSSAGAEPAPSRPEADSPGFPGGSGGGGVVSHPAHAARAGSNRSDDDATAPPSVAEEGPHAAPRAPARPPPTAPDPAASGVGSSACRWPGGLAPTGAARPPSARDPLLEVRGLSRDYPLPRRILAPGRVHHAVRDVSLDVHHGESVGLVGSSGCGKSTLARAVLGLDPVQAGTIRLAGAPMTPAAGHPVRRRIQAVFQDPFGSFNPRHRVERLVAEPLHLIPDAPRGAARRGAVAEALEAVGLPPDAGRRHIHAFSGGQRQRIAIARALIIRPALIVLDEAVSALDVRVRARVLDLLADLQGRFGLAYLFISHDLTVVRAITDRVLVMEAGRIVEEGATGAVFAAPRHPTTRALIEAAPRLPGTAAQRSPA